MAAKKGYQPPSRDEVLAMRAQKGQQMSGAALEAARRAQTIRDGLDRLPMLTDAIIEAFRQEDWKTLGYASFTAYTLAEFGERLNLTPAQRSVLVIAFVEAGMSKRAVAAAIGVDESTIRQDLKVAGNPAPREKSPLVNAVRQSIEDAAEKTSAASGEADQAEPVRAGTPEHSATGVGDAANVAGPEGDGDSPPIAVPTQTSGDHSQEIAPEENPPAPRNAGDEAAEDPSVEPPLEGSSAADLEAPGVLVRAGHPDSPDAGEPLGGAAYSAEGDDLLDPFDAVLPGDVVDEIEGLSAWLNRIPVDEVGPLLEGEQLDAIEAAAKNITRVVDLLRRWNSPESPQSAPGSPSPAVGVAAADGEVPDVSPVPETSGTEQGGAQ